MAASFVWAALREANSFDIGSMINSQTDLLRLRALGLKGKPRKAPVIHSIQWQPPPPGWMKVNTDGCSRGQPGPSSCGGIFRNCRGFVHGCFALSLGSGFAYQAEWVGVMTAIAIAHSKGWKSLWIESDSTYVVSLIRSRSIAVPWNFRNRWLLTLHLIRQMRVVASHIYREGNQAADALAGQDLNYIFSRLDLTKPLYLFF